MIKLPKNVALTIDHVTRWSNDFMPIEDMMEEIDDDEWTSPGEKRLATKARSFWRIQWKPDTSDSFYRWHASSLEALLVYVNAHYRNTIEIR